MNDDEQCGRGEGMEVELMTNAARLIREVIGRDLNRRRRFGMYQDQTDDLWKVVDMLEAAGKAGEEPK